MSEIKRVKIQNIVENQIPEFLNEESPLFSDFLEQYYLSQEYETGIVDLALNLNQYKKIDNFDTTTFYAGINTCRLSSDIFYFSDTIEVNNTKGFPEKYGLIKINDEIITYTGITTNTFTGCVRGFSGIEKSKENENLEFISTKALDHEQNSSVKNLSLDFFQILFKKFKSQFFPGFEDRTFSPNIELKNILFKARDFYTSKGTDVAFKILFDILYSNNVEVIKPQEYLISPSSSEYFITKNILVEQIIRDENSSTIDFSTLERLKGKSIFQTISGLEINAAIFNIEYRPFDDLTLYEISLDGESLTLDFFTTKKTKIIEDVSANSDSLIVDSTIGFKNSGSLIVKSDNLNFPISLTYQDKTVDQFIGVSGIVDSITNGSNVIEDNLLYIIDDDGTKFEFRLINIIQSIDTSSSSNLKSGDKISLSSFGKNLNNNLRFNTWLYNLPITHKIKTIEFNGPSLNIRLINQDVKFQPEVKLLLFNSKDTSEKQEVTVFNTFEDFNGKYVQVNVVPNYQKYDTLKQIITKGNSKNNYFLNVNKIITGIENTYIDGSEKNIYVASSGVPNYEFSATENKKYVSTSSEYSDTLIVPNHNFLTGEKIFYISAVSESTQNNRIKSGAYYVYKVDDTKIKISFSQSDLLIDKFIVSNIIIQNNSDYIVKFGYEQSSTSVKEIKDQKLFKKINLTKLNYSTTPKTTNDRPIGMLLNGVEINSPTLYDENIYYGKINSIIVDSKGNDYDVMNFSGIQINDLYGSGANAFAKLVGNVKEIKIISPGIGYKSKPKITLTGGNGKGAILEPNLVKTNIISYFKGDLNALDFNEESIKFLDNHNFDTGEEIIYNSNTNNQLPFLSINAKYFARRLTDKKISLHNTQNDALSGINTIVLTGISTGVHYFKTSNLKNTITKIFVKDPGEGYSNALISINSIPSLDNKTNGINIYDNYIFAKNHGFNSGDIVEYRTTEYPISGLSTSLQYCVKAIDANKFKLSNVGTGLDPITINLDKGKYVDLVGIGSGTHVFKYPPISIKVESLSSIDSVKTITPTLKPVILGKIENIFLENGGSNYGTPNIINFHRRPFVGISSILSDAVLKPVIFDGTIVSIQILNKGRGYSSDIDLIVVGSGKYAELDPVIENGRFQEVKVINGGVGYGQKTEILIKRRGIGAKFIANVDEWKINQVVKNDSLVTQDEEGILAPSKDINLGLKYTNFYPPKRLRYFLNDNISASGEEDTTQNKTPFVILGWAYDGNPIFGPYARFGSEIRKVNSSYRKLSEEEKNNLINNNLRPENSDYPLGFFTQDYVFDKKTTSGDLDEYNGMYINDPLLPGIEYGYFMTIDENIVSNPQYPYVIGNNFKDFSNYELFEPGFNQNSISPSLDISRNIGPYYIDSDGSSYKEINKVEKRFLQDFIVKNTYSSGITSILIYDPGINYKVGDRLVIDKTDPNENDSSIEVSRISGKTINSFDIGISTFKNARFVLSGQGVKVISSHPHNYSNGQEVLISSISERSKSSIEGFKKISVNEKISGITSNIPPQSVTGVTTYISVSDVSGFNVDDFIGIGTEVLKIIKVSVEDSNLYVNRSNGITTTHYAGISSVKLLPNTFLLQGEYNKITNRENKTIYFDPSLTVGLGTTGTYYYKTIPVLIDYATFNGGQRDFIGIGTAVLLPGDIIHGSNISTGATVVSVGIGSVQIFPITPWNSGITTNVVRIERLAYDKYVPPGSIYIENHNYYTGQELIYSFGQGGTGIAVTDFNTNVGPFQLTNLQKVYAINLGKNLVGLSTLGFSTTSGIGTELNGLTFNPPITSIGIAHSLRTVYPEITGKVESFYADITTSEQHNLKTFDKIKINSLPRISKTVKIRYDSAIRKITTDLIPFSASGIKTDTSEIPILLDSLKTGDKVVYYSNNNTSITNLENNKIYYILRENSDYVKLCDYYNDSVVGISKTLSSVGVGTHHFALVAPAINLSYGSILNFELDDTLYNVDNTLNFDFKLFYDLNFNNEVEKFKYKDENELISIDTTKYNFGTEIYYNIIPIDPEIDSTFTILDSDPEINGSNKIKIQRSVFDNYFSIISTGTTSFRFNVNSKPESVSYSKNYGFESVAYDTDSNNTLGPISKFKINYSGLNYKKSPRVNRIESVTGKNAIVKAFSDSIGKVDTLERVKDGFDYPTDYTLKPYLSVPTIVQIKNISRIESVGIITGGYGYKYPPSLKVIGNDEIQISAQLDGGSVNVVNIIKNVNNLSVPLEIVSLRNSNGIEINFIETSGTFVTLELINSDPILYPHIKAGIGSTSIVFPFNVGDKIFVENCRKDTQLENTDSFNSKDYGYAFFTITSIDTDNFTITYDMSEVKSNFNGTLLSGDANYSTDFGYGYVVNKKHMPVFDMNLIDDLLYLSGEPVYSNNFNGIVAENGWDNDTNQLTIIDSKGTLEQNSILSGEVSLLNGFVEKVNTFNLLASIGTYREKINDTIRRSGILNDFQHRISDNNYYQKFSYALKSEIPYSTWKESVLSLAHPSGFKEFSDLDIISKPSNSLRVSVTDSSLNLKVNIDNYASMYIRNNFSMVSENDDNYFDNSIERVTVGAELSNVSGVGQTGPVFGIALRPYILNKSNKVLQIDDISNQFDGSNEFINLGDKIIEIKSLEPNFIGISTANLQIGDYLGFSTYIQPNTIITGITTNKVSINKPHKLSPYYTKIATVNVNTTVDNAGAYSYNDTFDSTAFGFDLTSVKFDSN